ncbi:UDP-glucuronosyltransferase 2B19-like [Diadema antillarum]|uniref:UDP-glucuronosyltransferase 2B19-like n=1 Tax=Diadema antillarum TaxID=105358 RepID=UPI003A88A2C3
MATNTVSVMLTLILSLALISSSCCGATEINASGSHARGNILLMFQGCGVKTSLFNVGLRLGAALYAHGFNVSFVVTHTNGTSSAYDELRDYQKIFINSGEVSTQCRSHFHVSTRKEIGVQQLLNLLQPQWIGCDVLLRNETAMKQLRELDLDLIIGESFGPCYQILADILGGIPFAHFLVTSPEMLPPAIFPQTMAYTHDRSYFQRLQALVHQLSVHIFYQRLFAWYVTLARNFNVTSLDSHSELSASYGSASLWLSNSDPVLDFALPIPPNVIPLPDLGVRSAKPIQNDELNSILSRKESTGIVVVAVSSIEGLMTTKLQNDFVTGLGRVPFQVVWRRSKPQRLGVDENRSVQAIHFTGWLEHNDMNDLLGVTNTLVFVTTGGRCGAFEAIYHGVPTLCLPLYSEHYENCAKLVRLGMAQVIDVKSFSAEEVHKAVSELATNKSFKEQALHASKKFRSKPETAGERIAFWVEHVLQNGGSHLRQSGTGSVINFLQYACMGHGPFFNV